MHAKVGQIYKCFANSCPFIVLKIDPGKEIIYVRFIKHALEPVSGWITLNEKDVLIGELTHRVEYIIYGVEDV